VAAHSPEYLVKFAPIDIGKLILESRTLRWSAPHLFNDPFELTHESQLNFDPQILLQAAIKMATAMIFAKDDPRGNTPLVNAIRRWRDEERFASPEEAYDVLKELLSQVVDQRLHTIEHMMTEWRKYARSLRICSFSGKPNNLASWQQYADQHQGIAIRFQAGEYTSLPHPEKVLYKGPRPEISTLRSEMSVIMASAHYVAQDHFEEKFTHKAQHRSHEEEWRCFHRVKEEPGGPIGPDSEWYSDMSFERSEVSAIYLGANTPANSKRELIELIKEHYDQAKIFQCKVVPGKFEIDFEKVSIK
tara:strand:+ start:2415 stop:3323 length:909 start_codon:yes stop_codon:yes gene_type:complete